MKTKVKKRAPKRAQRKTPISKRRAVNGRGAYSYAVAPKRRKARRLNGRNEQVKTWFTMLMSGLLGGVPLKLGVNYVSNNMELKPWQKNTIDALMVGAPILASLKFKKFQKYLLPLSGSYATMLGLDYATQYLLKKESGALLGSGQQFLGAGTQFIERKPISQKVATMLMKQQNNEKKVTLGDSSELQNRWKSKSRTF